MPKTTGPTALIVHLSGTPPEELLRLVSLDLSPQMEKVLAERDALSTELEAIEAEAHATRQYISFCANSTENPALFETLIADGRTRLSGLETRQKQLRAQAVILDQAVNDVRVQTRLEILPAIRAIALPQVDARITQLEAIAMVDRLLMGKKSQLRTVRQRQDVEELAYLRLVRAMLSAEDPS